MAILRNYDNVEWDISTPGCPKSNADGTRAWRTSSHESPVCAFQTSPHFFIMVLASSAPPKSGNGCNPGTLFACRNPEQIAAL